MIEISGTYATTATGVGGFRLTLEELQQMEKILNQYYLPLQLENDPRLEPQGRIINAWIEQEEDVHVLKCRIEIFEENDSSLPLNQNRKIYLEKYQSGFSKILYDASFRNKIDIEILNRLSEILNSKFLPLFFYRKFVNPLRILKITAGTNLETFPKLLRFLNNQELLHKLHFLYHRNLEGIRERLLCFEFTFHEPGGWFNLELIIPRPSVEKLSLIPAGDNLINQFQPDFSKFGIPFKIVMLMEQAEFKSLYLLRSDCIIVTF